MYAMPGEEALKLWPPFKRMSGWIDSFKISHPNGLTLDEMHKAVAGYINTHYIHEEDHKKTLDAAGREVPEFEAYYAQVQKIVSLEAQVRRLEEALQWCSTTAKDGAKQGDPGSYFLSIYETADEALSTPATDKGKA